MRWTATILVLAAATLPAWAFTLVDNSSGPSVAVCPCCTSILNPYPIQYLPANGPDALGQGATILQDFPGANVVASASAAPGTLTVDEYYAWCKGMIGGAYLGARYDDGDGVSNWTLPWPFGGTRSYRWIQEINTNKPLGGATQPYIDPRPNDDKGVSLPYYWTDPEAIFKYTNGANSYGSYDLRFSDKPRRPCTQYVTWQADLFLVSENRFTDPQGDPVHQITIYDGVRWGFELYPSFWKLIGYRFYSLIVSETERLLDWSPIVVDSQLFGPQTLEILHSGGATTNAQGETFTDAAQRLETYHGEFYGPAECSFSVATGDGLSSLHVNVRELDVDLLVDFTVPIVEKPGVPAMSMVVNLERDWMLLVDETASERLDDALYVGPFSEFAENPEAFGFMLLGTSSVQLDNVWFPAPGEVPVGDANLDGFVDGADYTLWADNYMHERANWEQGDFNTDGVVDGADYTLWADNYAPLPPVGTVPEPAGLVLMCIAAAAAIRPRRRH